MGWPWIFVSLDAGQVAARRMYLDNFANIAQTSVLVPLLIIQLTFLVSWLHDRSIRQSSFETPSSPAVKRNGRSSQISKANANLRRQLWWLGGDLRLAGTSLGTKGEVLGGIAWASWLLLLTVLSTGNDYLHLTKRFGIVASSQLPFHYLLAVKTPYSPVQIVTRASHETLNAVHQILGRIITLFFYAHAILYINFYIKSDLLLAKIKQAYVICGIVAIIFFTLIGTSSLAPVRRWSYKVFLGVHIVLSIAVLPVLFFHVHHIRLYIYEVVVILVANITLRTLATKQYTDAKLRLLPGTQLLEIVIPMLKSSKQTWQAGQHTYISLPDQGIRAAVAKNPFTLCSLPNVDRELKFVARVQSGNTAALAATVKAHTQPLLVEGPYGLATHADRLLSYDRVLLLAGGIGATFIMPLYRQLLSDLSPSKGSQRRQKVNAVWIVRTASDVAWALPRDLGEGEGFLERLSVYVTRDAINSTSTSSRAPGKNAAVNDGDDGIELEEHATLLQETTDSASSDAKATASSWPLIAGRPNLEGLVDQTFAGGLSERVAIIVCGPVALGSAVRAETERWVLKGRDVWFWNESFSL